MIPEGREYRVRLHFSPKVAGNVAEVLWHETQEVAFNDDGSCEFRATVDGLGEILWWILGYGDEVRVVEPAALRKRIASRARAMADLYEDEEPDS
jgi:proteasome accessory factor B